MLESIAIHKWPHRRSPRGDEILHGSKGVNRRTDSNTVRDNCVSFIYTNAFISKQERSNTLFNSIFFCFFFLIQFLYGGPRISHLPFVKISVPYYFIWFEGRKTCPCNLKNVLLRKSAIVVSIFRIFFLIISATSNVIISKVTVDPTCWFSISIVTESWLRCYITWAWDIPVGGGNGMPEESRRPWHDNIWCAYLNIHR